MTRIPYRPDPSAADRMGGDPGIRIIKKATPEERAAAEKQYAEMLVEEEAIIAAQRAQGIIPSK